MLSVRPVQAAGAPTSPAAERQALDGHGMKVLVFSLFLVIGASACSRQYTLTGALGEGLADYLSVSATYTHLEKSGDDRVAVLSTIQNISDKHVRFRGYCVPAARWPRMVCPYGVVPFWVARREGCRHWDLYFRIDPQPIADVALISLAPGEKVTFSRTFAFGHQPGLCEMLGVAPQLWITRELNNCTAPVQYPLEPEFTYFADAH